MTAKWSDDLIGTSKTCFRCNTQFPIEEFKVGKCIRSYCRSCNKEYYKLARQKFREENPRKKRITADTVKDDMFQCYDCNEWKPLEAKSKQSFWCKSCKAIYEDNRRRKAGIKAKNKSYIDEINQTKLCTICKIEKPFVDFSPAKRGLGSLSTACKPCRNEKYYDKDAGREGTRRYRANNRERWRQLHRLNMFTRRTGIKCASDGTLTDEVLKELYLQTHCEYCKQFVERSKRTIDHKIPLIKGGLHSISNVTMACFTCNSSKSDDSVEDFLKRLYKK